ncbi:MAG: antibiotic biosynthesis monooxygenase [Candidatus Nanopelagicales bacterium]
MILETATISVIPGQEDAFLVALAEAKGVLARSEGWRDIHVRRGIERPSTFQLVIGWETLEHHTEGFRGGELFGQWRAIIGPHFAEPPQVEHWTIVD